MAGRILIIDTVATNRIVLKVKLASARYDAIVCATTVEAGKVISDSPPDLVIVGATSLTTDMARMLADLRGVAGRLAIPVIAVIDEGGTDSRVAMLRAGADDVLERPVTDVLLLARVRSLLRSRVAASDLRLRDDTTRALGFAETPATFAPASRITLVAPATTSAVMLSRLMERAAPRSVTLVDPTDVFDDTNAARPADVFVIDARTPWSIAGDSAVFGLISDLRSRVASRHAPILLITGADTFDLRTMAYDLGVDDAIGADASGEELAHRLTALSAQKRVMDSLRETVRSGIEAAVVDPLTGLHNRRFALSELTQMRRVGKRSGTRVAVMVLDIDHFKRVNDTLGHAAGDAVLVEVAKRLRASLRPRDLLARIGGEEFLVALSDTSDGEALTTAERLRAAVGSAAIALGSRAVTVTLSVGVALSRDRDTDASGDAMIARADAALYRAKARGRNKVTMGRSAA